MRVTRSGTKIREYKKCPKSEILIVQSNFGGGLNLIDPESSKGEDLGGNQSFGRFPELS